MVHRGLIALLAACAALATGAAAQEPGDLGGTRSVDVGGHRVRVLERGLDGRRPGEPVVVFEAGATNPLEVWSGVLPLVGERTPVVAYDRAGLGRSEWDGETPTPQHVADRLDRLLRAIGAEPPWVLVGFSWGGVLMRYFAAEHPDEVAGIVFVDPGPIVTQTAAEKLAPFDSVGAGRAGYDAFWNGYRGFFERAPAAVRAEFDVFHGLMERDLEERDVRPLPDVPIVVLVAGGYIPPPPGLSLPFDPVAHHAADVRHRLRMLEDWALASSRGTLVFANDLTHAIPGEDPELVVWAVERVLAAARGEPR